MNSKFFLVVIASILASGCASPNYQNFPITADNKAKHNIQIIDKEFEENHFIKKISENEVLYSQNNGGSAAAGAFGLIGALTNIALINSQTNKDVEAIKGKFDVNPSKMLKKAIKDNPAGDVHFTDEFKQSDIQVHPYVLIKKVEKNDATQLHFASAVKVQVPLDSKKNWYGRYFYITDTTITLSELSAGISDKLSKKIKSELQQGFAEVIKMYDEDRKSELSNAKPGTVRSEYLTPGFPIDLFAEEVSRIDGRVIFTTNNGSFSMPESEILITYTKSKKDKKSQNKVIAKEKEPTKL
ncbi:hypothetical protein [Paraferrimonas sp. SM1919]|uniref:hypothetical protein n=1 Tax=Paraferrimonas sp. SM1919 TaxID=2662263 RepID=UPI0013D3C388|nr:hypothetical protein [Paraferrimonas sp. SM1919]